MNFLPLFYIVSRRRDFHEQIQTGIPTLVQEGEYTNTHLISLATGLAFGIILPEVVFYNYSSQSGFHNALMTGDIRSNELNQH